MDNSYFMFVSFASSFVVGITTLYILYRYFTRNHGYWAKRGVPFCKPHSLFGFLWESLNESLHDIEVSRYRKYGSMYGHFEFNSPLLSVGDPELLRDILVKDFQFFTGGRTFSVGDDITEKMVLFARGEDWKRIRTIVTRTFSTGKIKRMLNIFKECSITLVSNFRMAAENREAIEAKRLYGAFSMDVIASAAFSTKIDSHNNPNNEFVKTARDVFKFDINWRFILLLLFPGIMKLFKIKIFSPKGLDFFGDVTLQIMEERKRTGQKRNDFLQLLMDSAEEVINDSKLHRLEKEENDIAENYGKIENDEVIKNANSSKKLSFNELLAQCVIFFVAGYDTVSSALSFATYCLALNPDIQEKLIRELDEALEENNGELTYETVQSMKYLDNVIAETLRLYPSIRTERVANDDYNLGNTGITIPKGMVVTIPIFAIHRDPKYYPNPEKFDPDRFIPEERAKRSQYAYIPFGAGPRHCVGMRFALMEIKVCLAEVLRNFRIKRCPETKVPLEFHTGQALLRPKEITVQIEIRKDGIKD